MDDLLFANLFGSDEIAAIDTDSGSVVAMGRRFGPPDRRRAEEADVLNGNRLPARHRDLLLTGKYWPWIFEVRILGYDPPPGQ